MSEVLFTAHWLDRLPQWTPRSAPVQDRRSPRVAESRLLAAVVGFYVDREGLTDQLLSLAEEYGPSRAITAMLGDVNQLGELAPTATDSYVADMADTLEASLESVLVAQDRLDQAVALRERQPAQAAGKIGRAWRT